MLCLLAATVPVTMFWKKLEAHQVYTLVFCGVMVFGFGPVITAFRATPRMDPNAPLPRQAQIRGAYVNTGSRDVGPDKPLGEYLKEQEAKEAKAS